MDITITFYKKGEEIGKASTSFEFAGQPISVEWENVEKLQTATGEPLDFFLDVWGSRTFEYTLTQWAKDEGLEAVVKKSGPPAIFFAI